MTRDTPDMASRLDDELVPRYAAPAFPDLVLAVKGTYFDQMRSGAKIEEFRLQNDYWAKRLEGRQYGRVVITLGYPKADDASRRLVFPWRGFRKCELLHEHFGASPVLVYAISVVPGKAL